jgi:hypothetical protein
VVALVVTQTMLISEVSAAKEFEISCIINEEFTDDEEEWRYCC